MHPRVIDILTAIGTPAESVRPTALYNEGWMLRLLLDWTRHHAEENHPLAFLPDARWYSEALLRSQFLARSRGDKLAESWTNADGVIGHFDIGKSSKGELTLRPDAKQFVVLEAKMYSKLSSGTKNTRGFDQAARNVACMAECLKKVEDRHQLDRLGFYVVAPKTQIDNGVFGNLVTKASVRQRVEERVAAYGDEKQKWFDECFTPTLQAVDVGLLSWEELLEGLEGDYLAFYHRCLLHNEPKRPAG